MYKTQMALQRAIRQAKRNAVIKAKRNMRRRTKSSEVSLRNLLEPITTAEEKIVSGKKEMIEQAYYIKDAMLSYLPEDDRDKFEQNIDYHISQMERKGNYDNFPFSVESLLKEYLD